MHDIFDFKVYDYEYIDYWSQPFLFGLMNQFH